VSYTSSVTVVTASPQGEAFKWELQPNKKEPLLRVALLHKFDIELQYIFFGRDTKFFLLFILFFKTKRTTLASGSFA